MRLKKVGLLFFCLEFEIGFGMGLELDKGLEFNLEIGLGLELKLELKFYTEILF
jgi:hypothetical protein